MTTRLPVGRQGFVTRINTDETQKIKLKSKKFYITKNSAWFTSSKIEKAEFFGNNITEVTTRRFTSDRKQIARNLISHNKLISLVLYS